jgi:hypothetical protein
MKDIYGESLIDHLIEGGGIIMKYKSPLNGVFTKDEGILGGFFFDRVSFCGRI